MDRLDAKILPAAVKILEKVPLLRPWQEFEEPMRTGVRLGTKIHARAVAIGLAECRLLAREGKAFHWNNGFYKALMG